jgi:cation diffusion facilitator family transporter
VTRIKPFSTRTSAAGLSIASNTTLILLKLGVGLWTGSVSVIAEAIHSSVDLLAAIIAFASVRASVRPPDEDHQFGHGKIEGVSGAVEGLLIFVGAGLIVNEAVGKLAGEHELQAPMLGAVVMLVSAVTNIVVSRHLHNMARRYDSLALEADAEHLRTDVITSFGVFGGLILVEVFQVPVLDPILGLGVALLIIGAAYSITLKSYQTLVDRRLPLEEIEVIERVLAEHAPQFLEYHRLRTRKSGPHRYVTIDVVLRPDTPLLTVHETIDHLEEEIRGKLPNTSVLIHPEPPGTEDRV